MQKIATLSTVMATAVMLAVGNAKVTASTNDNLPALLEDMSLTRRYLSDTEFTIETLRKDQASNPWCVDAIGCEQGDVLCIGSTVGLRVCDPGTFPTQVFTQDSRLYIYLAFSVGLCFQVNFSNQLAVTNFCEDDRRKLEEDFSPISGIRRFDVSDGQLVALADDGSRFPAAIDPDSGVSAELIFVDERDPMAIDVDAEFSCTHPQAPTLA